MLRGTIGRWRRPTPKANDDSVILDAIIAAAKRSDPTNGAWLRGFVLGQAAMRNKLHRGIPADTPPQ